MHSTRKMVNWLHKCLLTQLVISACTLRLGLEMEYQDTCIVNRLIYVYCINVLSVIYALYYCIICFLSGFSSLLGSQLGKVLKHMLKVQPVVRGFMLSEALLTEFSLWL